MVTKEWELTSEEMRQVLIKSEFYDPTPSPKCRPVAKAQAKKLVEWLDLEFIINALKQSQGMIWQKKGQHICREQIRKLEALKKEVGL